MTKQSTEELAKSAAGKMAFRINGDMWECHWVALKDGKEVGEPTLLGTIRLHLVVNNESVRQAFMALIREGMTPILSEAAGGAEPDWQVRFPGAN